MQARARLARAWSGGVRKAGIDCTPQLPGRRSAMTVRSRQAVDLGDYPLLSNMQVIEQPASQIVSIGGCLPERVVDNEELVQMVKAPRSIKRRLSAVIERMTGVETRRYAEPGTSPSDLAVAACLQALEMASVDAADIDTLVFASTDMDTLEPATANIVQTKLGITTTNSFDVSNACNSFIQALNVANSLIATGASKRVLITTGEIGSYVVNREIHDKDDLRVKLGGLTLGDAGAAMIVAQSSGSSGISEVNLLSMGEHWQLCHVPETTDWRQRSDGTVHGWFYLDMPELAKVVRPTTVDYFNQYKDYRHRAFGEHYFMNSIVRLIPHQISTVLIDEMVVATGCDPEKICISANVWGNTASASIPLTLQRAVEQDGLELGSGQDVMLYGAASGYSLGHLRLKL
jgi:3-oxoacyl-[acyl-carrier-protein] synthase-3